MEPSGTVRPSFWSRLPNWKTEGELAPGPLAVLMILPAVLFLVAIIAYPVLYALWLSLHEVTLKGLAKGDMPFAGLATALAGGVFGIPSLRLKGLYLAIATLAAQQIIQWAIVRSPLGTDALVVPSITVVGNRISRFEIGAFVRCRVVQDAGRRVLAHFAMTPARRRMARKTSGSGRTR